MLNVGKFKNMIRNEMVSYVFRDEYVFIVLFFVLVDLYMLYYFILEGVEFLFDVYGFKGDYIEFINFV